MIDQDYVLEAVKKYRPAQILEWVKEGLRGERLLPSRGGWVEEPREAPLVELLRAGPRAAPEVRNAIIHGCEELYLQFKRYLMSGPQERAKHEEARDIALRLCRLAGMAHPPELKGEAKAIFETVLDLPPHKKVDDLLEAAVVGAAMAYQSSEFDAAGWLKLMKERPDLAALAFRALLRISPSHPRVEDALVQLWIDKTREELSTDTAFLTLACAEATDESCWQRIFEKLRELAPDVWEKLETSEDPLVRDRISKLPSKGGVNFDIVDTEKTLGQDIGPSLSTFKLMQADIVKESMAKLLRARDKASDQFDLMTDIINDTYSWLNQGKGYKMARKEADYYSWLNHDKGLKTGRKEADDETVFKEGKKHAV